MDSRFFEWLRSINKLDLWEALLDTVEDFSDIAHNLRAWKEIHIIEEQWKNQ